MSLICKDGEKEIGKIKPDAECTHIGKTDTFMNFVFDGKPIAVGLVHIQKVIVRKKLSRPDDQRHVIYLYEMELPDIMLEFLYTELNLSYVAALDKKVLAIRERIFLGIHNGILNDIHKATLSQPHIGNKKVDLTIEQLLYLQNYCQVKQEEIEEINQRSVNFMLISQALEKHI